MACAELEIHAVMVLTSQFALGAWSPGERSGLKVIMLGVCIEVKLKPWKWTKAVTKGEISVKHKGQGCWDFWFGGEQRKEEGVCRDGLCFVGRFLFLFSGWRQNSIGKHLIF